jgi:hypothetical protein
MPGPASSICLGYLDEKKWHGMSESERNAFFDEYFAYDEVLKANGHYAAGQALQNSRTAATVRIKDGKVSVTDRPFIETKEQLGGILTIEAKDMAKAIELISKHPGVREAGFEIRPADDITAVISESEQPRRSATKG